FSAQNGKKLLGLPCLTHCGVLVPFHAFGGVLQSKDMDGHHSRGVSHACGAEMHILPEGPPGVVVRVSSSAANASHTNPDFSSILCKCQVFHAGSRKYSPRFRFLALSH